MHKIQHYDVSSINTNTYAYFYLLDGYGESLIKKQFSVKSHAWSFFVKKGAVCDLICNFYLRSTDIHDGYLMYNATHPTHYTDYSMLTVEFDNPSKAHTQHNFVAIFRPKL